MCLLLFSVVYVSLKGSGLCSVYFLECCYSIMTLMTGMNQKESGRNLHVRIVLEGLRKHREILFAFLWFICVNLPM